MPKAKQIAKDNAVEFNGTVYGPGDEDAMEAAITAYGDGGVTAEDKQRRKAIVDHTWENIEKQGAYGMADKDGNVTITVDHPDATLRAGAVARQRAHLDAEVIKVTMPTLEPLAAEQQAADEKAAAARSVPGAPRAVPAKGSRGKK